jgi:hypothetical protein
MSGEVIACVIDPIRGRQAAIETLITGIEAGDFPVLLYTPLDARKVNEILDVQRRTGADILFFGRDDQAEHLRRAVDRMGTRSAASLLLQELAPEFRRLPMQLGAPCTGLFGGLSIPETVSELFALASVEVRTGNRWMNRAKLRGAERVLACARLMLTWDDVRDPASNLAHVAARAGIGSERALYNAYRDYSGLPPRRAARDLRTAELAARVASATRS